MTSTSIVIGFIALGSLIAIWLGYTLRSSSGWIILTAVSIALGLGVFLAFMSFIFYGACLDVFNLCKPTSAENIFHFILPVWPGLGLFWVLIVVSTFVASGVFKK
jgi:hypothetical protein